MLMSFHVSDIWIVNEAWGFGIDRGTAHVWRGNGPILDSNVNMSHEMQISEKKILILTFGFIIQGDSLFLKVFDYFR